MSAFAGTVVPRGEWSIGPLGRVELVEGGRAVVVLGWVLYASLHNLVIAKVPMLVYRRVDAWERITVCGILFLERLDGVLLVVGGYART